MVQLAALLDLGITVSPYKYRKYRNVIFNPNCAIRYCGIQGQGNLEVEQDASDVDRAEEIILELRLPVEC